MREKKGRDSGLPPVDMRTLTLTLTVSIFIALLAFFMVLNAFSPESSVKAKRLQASLSNTFGFVGNGRSDSNGTGGGAGTAGDAEEAAAAGLRSVLPDVGFQQSHVGDQGQMMVVDIPRDEFAARWPELRSRLADVMVNHNRGGGHQIQILALDGPAHAGDLVQMAHDLNQDGVDTDLISVGYLDRGLPSVELRFITVGGS